MTILMISIPLMVLAVAIAVVPLVVMSYADHRRRQAESDRRASVPDEALAVDDRAVPMAA
jgi:hypothetical protein